jgi:hypothetical protein
MESQDNSASPTTSQFDFCNFNFETPSKKIDDPSSLEKFKLSEGYRELLAFITALQKSCENTRMSQTTLPETLQPIYSFLEEIDGWVDEIPPIE